MTAVLRLLQTIPLLSRLTDEQLGAILSASSSCVFHKDEQLFAAGSVADAAYFLLDGKLECLTEEDGEIIANGVSAGSTLLEIAMIVEVKPNSTCVARGTCQLLRLPREPILKLMEQDGAMTETLIGTLTERLQGAAAQMRESSAPFIDTRRSA